MVKQIKVQTTTLSSKGQVVLPEEVRQRLNLKEGDKFLVIAADDSVLLKAVNPITKEEFNKMLEKTSAAARRADITKEDLKEAIKKARNA